MSIHETRPWGKFEVLLERPETKVKILTVKCGKKLSLQSHQNRDEFWYILKGNPTVQVGEMRFMVPTGQHIFVRRGEKHRIENNLLEEVHILEVQVGQSFEESDIVRYEDDFGRVNNAK